MSAAGIPDAWNATERAVVTATVPELIRRQADRTPEAEALSFEGRGLSYRQLCTRMDRWAARLTASGAGPGRVVAVAVPRGDAFVIACLAVLASGAAYLPVDVELPPQRIEYMLRDASNVCAFVSAESAELYRRANGTGPVLRIGPGGTADDAEAADADATEPLPADDAYVMYTSGSTGRPKGVAVSHLSLANHLAWMQDTYTLGAGDRVLHKTPAGFDVSVWELLWPLTVGAALVVAPPGAHRDPRALAELVEAERITTMHFVPSVLDAFLRELDKGSCDTLRTVIASGEALSAELCHRFSETLGAQLHNLYGPTEATIDVTSWRCPSGPAAGPVMIGRPVANTRAYVLDDELRPVPPGVEGELYISGIQLARGYLNRPSLTARQFVPCPFEAEGGRMYRTGDRAVWSPEGELRYLGRTDGQVKVNGVRIEPGEIESVLEDHAAVRSAAVVAVEVETGVTALFAFVTPADHTSRGVLEGVDLDTLLSSLRGWLEERLPTAFMPAAISAVAEFPVTRSGKLDRRALAPRATPGVREPGREPATDAERRLCAFVGAALRVPAPGVDDNFFALGLTSMAAAKLAGEISRGFGVRFRLREVLRHPTVAGLARQVAELERGAAAESRG